MSSMFAAPKLGPAQKAEIIELIYKEKGLPRAAERAHVSLRSVMECLDEDQDFKLAVNKAIGHLTSVGEQELMRRAIDGIENYVVSQGRVVMVPSPDDDGTFVPLVERKYSDTLLQKWLAARARDTFGDKVEVEHKVSGHIAVPVISREDLLRALESGQSLDFTPQEIIDGTYKVLPAPSEEPEEPPLADFVDHDEMEQSDILSETDDFDII